MPLFPKTSQELAAREAQLLEEIRGLRGQLRKSEAERAELRDRTKLTAEIEDLQRERVAKEIELDRVKEKHAEQDRTIKHKVGLERQRQEFEIDQARREATVSVREQALAAERELFEAEMKFMRERFEKEVGRLETMYAQVLERLPHVTVDRQISDLAEERPRRRGAASHE